MASGSSSSARQPQPLAGPMSTRLEKSKFRYPVEHGAAFVELRDDTMSGEEVFQILETVPCVGRVYWQISKHAQGNKSLRLVGTPYTGVGHLLEQNVMVKSMIFRRPFEFELTRSMHTKKQGTCSITFKKALAGQLLEAWRILRRASMDRVLLSSSKEFDGQSSFCYRCLSFRPCSSFFRCCLVRKANPKQYTHTHTRHCM